MRTETICLAPWRALTIKTSGEIVPDIHYRGTMGNIRAKTLREIFDSPQMEELRTSMLAGEWRENCEGCRKKEATMGHSRRKFFKDWLREDPTALNGRSPTSLVYLDINFSNVCNLKCRMCNGQVSTAWIKDEERLKTLSRDYIRPVIAEHQKINTEDVKRFIGDPALLMDLKFLALRGGEPFLEEENYKFMSLLADWGVASRVSLDLSTNLTVYDERIPKIAENFKQIDLYVSLEGIGPLYEYIRGGSNFSFTQFERNLTEFRKLKNLTVMFTVAVSAYNILYLDEIWNWYSSHRMHGEEISFSNAVVNPEYLNYQILPDSLRRLAWERLQKLEGHRGPRHSGKRLVGDSGLEMIEASLIKSSHYDEAQRTELWHQFHQFNSDLDVIRGTRWSDVAPEFTVFSEVTNGFGNSNAIDHAVPRKFRPGDAFA